MRDAACSPAVVNAAYARYLLTVPEPISANGITVWELSTLYLDNVKRTRGADSTYHSRASVLFDFCTGLPRKWWNPENGQAKGRPTTKDYTHAGYGKMLAADVRTHHVYDWLGKHPGWGPGSTRMNLQARRVIPRHGGAL